MLPFVQVPTAELGKVKSTHLHLINGLLAFCDPCKRDRVCFPSMRKLLARASGAQSLDGLRLTGSLLVPTRRI